MMVCEVWLSADFLARNGWLVTVRPDGRVTASRDGVTCLLPGVCGHDLVDCPPLVPARPLGVAA
ncbi:hypothetical protein [Micromonospora sp. NBC_00421]|uniref:hypothetical protein n=1 Tax=Micromonospora sp. NBC_00421 TaxID=2975976 RepID=UPI002E22D4F5